VLETSRDTALGVCSHVIQSIRGYTVCRALPNRIIQTKAPYLVSYEMNKSVLVDTFISELPTSTYAGLTKLAELSDQIEQNSYKFLPLATTVSILILEGNYLQQTRWLK
jgi:hypothetical protein